MPLKCDCCEKTGIPIVKCSFSFTLNDTHDVLFNFVCTKCAWRICDTSINMSEIFSETTKLMLAAYGRQFNEVH